MIGSRGYPSTYGGFETFVRHLAPYLVECGDYVTVYDRENERPGTRMLADGVRVVTTRGVATRNASTLTFGRSAIRHAAAEKVDAALVLNCANGFWLSGLRNAGVPTLVNVDGLEWERDKWSGLGKRVFRTGAVLTARYADRLVADSVGIQAYWNQHFGVDPMFIPYGADVLPDTGTDRLAEHGLTPGGYVLVVARLVPENNVDLTLAALRRSASRHRVVVVGSAAPGDPIGEALRDLGQGLDIRWMGHVEDQHLLQQLWQHCGVYVHGHSVGGTNPALLQALGAGCPTVALDTVYNREVVTDVCPTFPRDPDRLAELIDAVMADDQRRDRMIHGGREIVRTRYCWDDVCRDYRDALHALIRERSTSSVPSGR